MDKIISSLAEAKIQILGLSKVKITTREEVLWAQGKNLLLSHHWTNVIIQFGTK